MAAAEDRMIRMCERLADGKAICIRQHALLYSRTRHRPCICTDNIGGTNARETVLVEGGNRDMIEPRWNQGNFECIQTVLQQLLKVTGREVLVSADLNQLLQECHTGSPDLSVCRRIRKTPFGICFRSPHLQRLWHFQFREEFVECMGTLMRRAPLPTKILCQQ